MIDLYHSDGSDFLKYDHEPIKIEVYDLDSGENIGGLTTFARNSSVWGSVIPKDGSYIIAIYNTDFETQFRLSASVWDQ